VNDWLARYGAIALGIGIGTSAKYGLALSEGKIPSWRGVIADCLLMGMVALLALFVTDRMSLSGSSATLCASLFAISSDRVIRLIRDRFERKVQEVEI